VEVRIERVEVEGQVVGGSPSEINRPALALARLGEQRRARQVGIEHAGAVAVRPGRRQTEGRSGGIYLRATCWSRCLAIRDVRIPEYFLAFALQRAFFVERLHH